MEKVFLKACIWCDIHSEFHFDNHFVDGKFICKCVNKRNKEETIPIHPTHYWCVYYNVGSYQVNEWNSGVFHVYPADTKYMRKDNVRFNNDIKNNSIDEIITSLLFS